MNRQEILDEAIGMAQGNNQMGMAIRSGIAFSEPDYIDGFLAAAAPREELIAELVGALTGVGNVLVAHMKDGHGNPPCGWDFAVTMALVDAALAKAGARQ